MTRYYYWYQDVPGAVWRMSRNEAVEFHAQVAARNIFTNLRIDYGTWHPAILALMRYWVEVHGGLVPQLLLPVPQFA